MEKLIKLGVEARLHDTRISYIEELSYSGQISADESFERIEKELIRYNLAWAKIMNETKEETKHKLIMQDHDCKDNEYGNDCEYCNSIRKMYKTN